MPSSVAQRFLDWRGLRSTVHRSKDAYALVVSHAETEQGRRRIAQSYLQPTSLRFESYLFDEVRVQQICYDLEGFIRLFPRAEQFSPELMDLRELLMKVYARLSPNYEYDQGEIVDLNGVDLERKSEEEFISALDDNYMSRFDRDDIV